MDSSVSFFGIEVNLLDKFTLTDKIIDALDGNKTILVPNHNLHSLYLFHKYKKFRDFYLLSDITHIDGMSLVFLGKFCSQPIKTEHRITYLDWVDILFERLHNENKKVFYLGSKPGIAAKAAKILHDRYPNVNIEVNDGYFDVHGQENEEVISKINKFDPDVLMIGMGMPRQEYWVMDNYHKINAKAILTSGACFDYIAGETKTPPRFLGSLGLEWLYRLLSEPKRLWKRYLLEPLELVWLLIKNK